MNNSLTSRPDAIFNSNWERHNINWERQNIKWKRQGGVGWGIFKVFCDYEGQRAKVLLSHVECTGCQAHMSAQKKELRHFQPVRDCKVRLIQDGSFLTMSRRTTGLAVSNCGSNLRPTPPHHIPSRRFHLILWRSQFMLWCFPINYDTFEN